MRRIFFLMLLFFCAVIANAQNPPFWNDIQAFKKQDSISFPQAGQILFVGSSSFTRWQDVQQYFPAYTIINRGFGGSTLKDLIRYANDIILPYKARQIVIYCGENDFAESDTISVPVVVNRFKTLYDIIRSKYTDVPIAYVSMKPSPSRRHLMPKFVEANRIIADFLKTRKYTAFINVYDKMLKADGEPIDDIFVQDRLHMNRNGYVIWQKEIEPFLVK